MYLAYIRKSRYDRDYADLSIEETLKRHRTILESFAKSQNIIITQVFEEVVSGESLAERPEMQKLLRIVEQGGVSGVLCVDPDRLSRGNSIDQGIITQTFKYTGTKIITPYKTYDPSDEYDEEFFEFNLFMSRKEYMLINRRLERGRKRSAAEGRFMGSVAPYGYRIVKIKGDKGNTLEIVPEEAEIVKYIYQVYLEQGIGFTRIADLLNSLNIPTRTGVPWSNAVVSVLLHNVVYTGKIRCSHKKTTKKLVDGVVKKSRHYDFSCPVYEGKHPAIIDDETFEKAQAIREINKKNQTPIAHQFFNVFSGIAYCAECGSRMTGTVSRGDRRIICANRKCKVMSSQFHVFEAAAMDAIRVWMGRYAPNTALAQKDQRIAPLKKSITRADAEIKKLQVQLDRTFELLEQGVYDITIFQSRRASIESQIEEQIKKRQEYDLQLKAIDEEVTRHTTIIPKIKNLFDNYDSLSAEEKNHMYKEILSKITYQKNSKTREITIDIFPRL